MISNYTNKSELYLDAADALMKSQDGHYAVVPHTTYYSCLLYMEHICYVVKGKTENDIRPIKKDGSKTSLHVGLRKSASGWLSEDLIQGKYDGIVAVPFMLLLFSSFSIFF